MYETYYGLSADPFRLSPDHSFCFRHHSYARARAYLQYGLHRAEGFVMVTGRPGTGKTTLINDVVAEIQGQAVLVARLVSTQLEADDLLRMVAYAFEISTETTNKAALLNRLETFLTERNRHGVRTLLIVDEAQHLSHPALEELRLLTNLQLNDHPLLQVFLVGQEELRAHVQDPSLEQLHQRFIATCHLEPLDTNETRGYMESRLRRTGWHGDPQLEDSMFELVHRASGGIPRRINHICSRLLLHGSLHDKHHLATADLDVVLSELREETLVAWDELEHVVASRQGAQAEAPECAPPPTHHAPVERTNSHAPAAPGPAPEPVPPPRYSEPRRAPGPSYHNVVAFRGQAVNLATHLPTRDPKAASAEPRPALQRSTAELPADDDLPFLSADPVPELTQRAEPAPPGPGSGRGRARGMLIGLLAAGIVVGAIAWVARDGGLPEWAQRAPSPPATAPSPVPPRVAPAPEPPSASPPPAPAAGTPEAAAPEPTPTNTGMVDPPGPVVPALPSAGVELLGSLAVGDPRPADPQALDEDPALAGPGGTTQGSGETDPAAATAHDRKPAPSVPAPAVQPARPFGALAEALDQGVLESQRIAPDRLRLGPRSLFTFAFDSSALRPGLREALQQLSRVVTDWDGIRVEIIGRTDHYGPDDYNARLAKRRAMAVADYLQDQGLDGQRVIVTGEGEAKARGPDTSSAAARRVDVYLQRTP